MIVWYALSDAEWPQSEHFPIIVCGPEGGDYSPQIVRDPDLLGDIVHDGACSWTPMAETGFDSVIAARLCDHVTEGGMLKGFADSVGLPRSTFYAWLRDPENMIDGEPFETRYALACKDRATSWLDDVLHDQEGIELSGTKFDAHQVRKRESIAGLKLKIAKDYLATGRAGSAGGSGGADMPRVVIMTFADPEEAEKEADEALEEATGAAT